MAKLTDITLLQQPEQHALLIRNRSSVAEFSRHIGEGFMNIGSYVKELGLEPADMPFVEYPGFENMDENNIEFNVGFYMPTAVPAKERIESVTIPARKVAVCLHKGTYDEIGNLYNEMMGWIKSKGFEATGASIEHYYTGPEVPESESITRVVMPIME